MVMLFTVMDSELGVFLLTCSVYSKEALRAIIFHPIWKILLHEQSYIKTEVKTAHQIYRFKYVAAFDLQGLWEIYIASAILLFIHIYNYVASQYSSSV